MMQVLTQVSISAGLEWVQRNRKGRKVTRTPHPTILNARFEPQDFAGSQTFQLLGCIPSLNLSDVINASKG